jgi:uncharacterized protein (TIGR00251 family)
VTIKIKVIPRAKKESIKEELAGLKVYLTEPALEGRANKRLIELIAEHLHVKKYNITIVRGEHNREKVLEIRENS